MRGSGESCIIKPGTEGQAGTRKTGCRPGR